MATRRDNELRRRVQAELDWEPALRDQEIALTVRNGIVTLWGKVFDADQKYLANAAARRVPGVEAVTDQLRVGSDGRPKPRCLDFGLDHEQKAGRSDAG